MQSRHSFISFFKVNLDEVLNFLKEEKKVSSILNFTNETELQYEYDQELFTSQVGRVVKALDLRSGPHMGSWVRVPHLTIFFLF